MSQLVRTRTLPFLRTTRHKSRPFQIVNVAACPTCGSLVRRSRLAWWRRLFRKAVGHFNCGQCGAKFIRRA